MWHPFVEFYANSVDQFLRNPAKTLTNAGENVSFPMTLSVLG